MDDGLKHLHIGGEQLWLSLLSPLSSVIARETDCLSTTYCSVSADGFAPHIGALRPGQGASGVNRTRFVNLASIVGFIDYSSVISCASRAWWRVTAQLCRARLRICRIARHTGDRSSTASISVLAAGPTLPGQALRSGAA